MRDPAIENQLFSRRRILVVANETVEGPVLRQVIRSRVAGDDAEVLVIAPALNARLRHWFSDEGAPQTLVFG